VVAVLGPAPRCTLPPVTFDRSAFLSGVKDVLPMTLGAVPFGLITGVSAVGMGMHEVDIVLMSATVFAGASQLAAISLIGTGASIWVVLLTTAMINLRHVMYSASLVPWLERYSLGSRLLMAFLMTDHAYAFGVLRYREEDASFSRRDYFLGVGSIIWVAWVSATAVGAIVGTQVPAVWQLDFAVPLMFLALLVPAVRTRPALLAAATGGALALALAPLPFNLGLVAAASAGIVVGAAAEAFQRAAR
jgi:4-azaleucine resistance transporter AzlC